MGPILKDRRHGLENGSTGGVVRFSVGGHRIGFLYGYGEGTRMYVGLGDESRDETTKPSKDK
jgi:hypothetical protein